MRKDGYIIEEIIEISNMEESFDYVMRGRKRKTSRTGRYIMKHKQEVISDLQNKIGNGSYSISQFKEYTINERGKERTIQSIPLKDRIALNAIMRVVEKHLNKRFIADSAASIKGRGGHYLHVRMLDDIHDYPDETRFVYKCDIRKFYQSVNQDVMKFVVRRFFKDKKLIAILDRCIGMLPEGLSIGLRTSQALGNLLLSYYIDHVLKDKEGVAFLRRYCDDIVVQDSSYRELTHISQLIHSLTAKAGLEIKKNEQMFDLMKRDIDFLGYRVFGDGKIEIRKHIKQRFARRWKRVKSKKRKLEIAGSFYGIAKHAHAKHLFKTITGISMKTFAEFGLNYKRADGKKSFDCTPYSLGDLFNRTLEIRDFERNVKTGQGEGRYLVKFFDKELGEGKFFTASDELKQMLDKIEEMGGFPFQTTIRRQMFGKGKVKYSFT